MGTLATLTVNLVANSAKFASELAKSRKRSKSWSAGVRSHLGSVAKAGATMAAGIALSFLAMTNAQASNIDAMAKTADKIGVQVESLQRLRYQTELNGASTKTLEMGLQRMTRRVSEAAQGTGESVAALKELRLDAAKLALMKPDQQFEAIAGAMKNVARQGDRVRLTMKLFDSEGVSLVNTLTSDLKASREEFESLGITITRQQAAMVEQYNDSKTQLSTIWTGFSQQMTVASAPYFKAFVQWVTSATKSAGGMGQVTVTAMNYAAKGVGFVADAFWGLRGIIKLVQAGFATFVSGFLEGLDWIYQKAADLAEVVGEKWDRKNWANGLSESFSQQAEQAFKDFDAIAARKRPSIAIEAKVKQINSEIDKLVASKTANPAIKAAENLNYLAASAKQAADATKPKEGKFNDWKFNSYATQLQSSIYKGNTRDIAYFQAMLKDTLENRKRSAYFDKWDIDGMQKQYNDLLRQTPENLGEINLNLKTDSGTVSGTVKGDSGFMKELASSLKQAAQVTA